MGVRKTWMALVGAWCVLSGPTWAAGGDPATAFVSGQATPGDLVSAVSNSLGSWSLGNRVANTGRMSSLGPDFLWGVAASGFQSEGHAPDSNWTRYIAKNATYDAYGDSVDFYKHHEADLDRAAALGVKVFRISIEWARIEPKDGLVDPAAWAFYDAVIQGIVKRGMRPMLTLDHWVYPGWMLTRGGWGSAEMPANWLKHARRVVDRYARYNPIWITINEPTFYLKNEIGNGGLKLQDIQKMNDGLVAVHRGIYDYIHANQTGAMVASNVAFVSGLEAPLDALFFNRVTDKQDFIGIDYYGLSTSDLSSLAGLLSNKLWEIRLQPEGIYYALRYYAERFPKLPLYIIENGMPTNDGLPRADGQQRDDALRDTIYWLQRAKADGIKLMGYNYWSLTDNYEWGSYQPRFGLYTVNVKSDPTLAREPTSAVAAYAAVIAAQGVPLTYKPKVAPQACSLVAPAASCLRPERVKQ